MQSESPRLGLLTHASELHSRAAQLEGIPDQADLGTVQVRGIQVKVVQQALDAPRDAPAGNPVHAACGGKGASWGHVPPSGAHWEVGSHLSVSLGVSASAQRVFGAVYCRVLTSTPGPHPPDARSASLVMIIKNRNIAPRVPWVQNHPGWRITGRNRWLDRQTNRKMDG